MIKMNIEEIREHYTAKKLESIAEKLPQEDAFEMYDTMESIARILIGNAAFCAMGATDPGLKKLTKGHLDEAGLWADYLNEQKVKYKS